MVPPAKHLQQKSRSAPHAQMTKESGFEPNPKFHPHEFSSPHTPWTLRHMKGESLESLVGASAIIWEHKIQMRSGRLSLGKYRFPHKCHCLDRWKPWVSGQTQQAPKAQAVLLRGLSYREHLRITKLVWFPLFLSHSPVRVLRSFRPALILFSLILHPLLASGHL